MSRRKFDVVIGNPPYQAEAQGEGTRDTPLYHEFMEAAYEVSKQAVIITPARFLSNAGLTPKAWNAKMLADPHLRVAHFEPDSNRLFPGLSDPIKGGIVVTHRDSQRRLGPIGTFTKHPELNEILHKVVDAGIFSLEPVITSSRSYRYTDKLYEDNPDARALRPVGNAALVSTNAFGQFAFLYRDEKPQDGHEYARVLGLDGKKRAQRWLRRDYIAGPPSFDAYKVAVPAANGSGSTTDFFGVPLTNPTVLEPEVAVTQTFITVGSFASESEAETCLKYVKSKFARTLLGVLKVTQHNPASTWKYVPTQNFTPASDIDWSEDVPGIDAQLYAKYGLDDGEIAFIEAHVKPME